MLQPWARLTSRYAGWLVIAPTLLIIGLMVAFTDPTSASPVSQPRTLTQTVAFQEQTPTCQSCHPDQYAAWKGTPHANATLDPIFHDQFAKVKDQSTCLACHTTGFEKSSGKFLSEGVTCEACHGPYKEGHPNKITMQLPMASETCKVCHAATFAEWEQSSHATKNIECFDCHMAHNQGLRTGSEEKLCGACHVDRQTQVAHATHGINGVECGNCHMATEQVPNVDGSPMTVRNHTFKVSTSVCAGCHEKTIHTGNVLPSLRQQVAQADPNQQSQKAGAVPQLEKLLSETQNRLESLRNSSLLGIGLALALGAFAGLLAGIVGIALWQKRSSQ
jgi:formate-dependent nitrite reductase cytochrome c552 subunit